MAEDANASSSVNADKELEDGEIDDLEEGEISEDVPSITKYHFNPKEGQSVPTIPNERRSEADARPDRQNFHTRNPPRKPNFSRRNVDQRPFPSERDYQRWHSAGLGDYSNNRRQFRPPQGNRNYSHRNDQNDDFYQFRHHRQLGTYPPTITNIKYQNNPSYHDKFSTQPLPIPKSDFGENLSSDQVDSDDFELLLKRYKQIQEQLDRLDPSTQQDSFVDDLIDDTFVDIPLGNENESLDQEKENTIGSLEENFHETAPRPENSELSVFNQVLENREEYVPGEFSPFRIHPAPKKVRTLSELNRLDLLDKGVDVQQDGNEKGLNLTSFGSVSAESGHQLGGEQSLSKTKSRRRRKVNRRRRKVPGGGSRSSGKFSSSDVYEKLGVSVKRNSSHIGKNEREKKTILRRKERVKAWQKQQASAKNCSSLQIIQATQDDYVEKPMEVDSDSSRGVGTIEESVPPLPLVEVPPPPLPLENITATSHLVPLMQMRPFGSYPDEWINATTFPEISTERNQGFRSVGGYNFMGPNASVVLSDDVWGNDVVGDDDDDEASVQALRQQLLKSMVTKRAAKEVVANNEKVPRMSTENGHIASPLRRETSRPSSPGIAKSGKSAIKSTLKVNIPPPKHGPVLIKLGDDSDDSVESEDEAAGRIMGSIFGGLDSLIKEARERASKPKSPEPELPEQNSAEPTTPEALSVLSDEKRSEYKRLKQELAMREQKLKSSQMKPQQRKQLQKQQQRQQQPQIYQRNPQETSDKQTQLQESRKELQENVRDLDKKLKQHKTSISQDKKLLENTKNQLEDSSKALEEHESRVALLRQQLERAGRLKVVQKDLVNKLQIQNHRLNQRILKRETAAREVEESLLRSRALLAAHGAPPRNTVLQHKQRPSDVSKKKAGPKIDRNLALSLEDVRKRINELSQKLQKSMSTKRKKIEQENKVELQKSAPIPKTASLPRESGVPSSTKEEKLTKDELAKEKLRLRKLEEELSKRLRASNARQIEKLRSNTEEKGACSDSELLVKKSLPRGLTPPVELTTNSVNDKEVDVVDGGMDNALDSTWNMIKDSKELENIRKIQAERELNGPTFPSTLNQVAIPVLFTAAQCIWLDYKDSLLPQQLEAISGCTFTVKEPRPTVAKNELFLPDELLVPGPYRSPLLHLRSYRFSPYFRTKKGLSLNSLTYSHLIDPHVPFCSFDLHGICSDPDCHRQHMDDIIPKSDDILVDLAAYFPPAVNADSDKESIGKSVRTYVSSVSKQYQGKVSEAELRVLFVNQLKKKRKPSGVCNIVMERRPWRPLSYGRKNSDDISEDDSENIKFKTETTFSWKGWERRIQMEINPRSGVEEECQEVRYFSENYDNIATLEEATQNDPSDEALWIRLAVVHLGSKRTRADNNNNDDNIDNALNTLAQALELNRHSEKLWLKYLELFRCRGTLDEIYEVCEEAVSFSSSYIVWRTYLELVSGYEQKVDVCLRVIQFLMSSDFDSEVKSHRLLETFLYLVQLDKLTGRYTLALDRFQTALVDTSDSKDWCETLVSAVGNLICKDLCVLWLCYIHLLEFLYLPSDFFDPASGTLSRIVCKDGVVFPWKPGSGTNYGVPKLLSLFHRALKACAAVTKSRDKITPSVALYKNLFAFERACGKPESAVRSCQRLLKASPKVVEVWLCLAALEELRGDEKSATNVYKTALEKCNGHAQIAYSAAKYCLSKNNFRECQETLTYCVTKKFVVDGPDEGLKTRARSYEKKTIKPEPLFLYQKLLRQTIPVGSHVPPMKPNVNPSMLGDEYTYLWLCYCVFLELFSLGSPHERHQSAQAAYETAIQAIQERKHVKLLWTEYLHYMVRALQDKLCKGEEINEIFHRCLVTVPAVTPVPYAATKSWSDYKFHNEVMALYRTCLGDSLSSDFFDKYLELFPDNSTLAIQAVEQAYKSNDVARARKVLSTALLKTPYNLNLWKIGISMELRDRDVKQARQLYQHATEALPLAATLWNDYSLFELTHDKSTDEHSHSINSIIKKAKEHGVNIEDFLKKLLSKSE